MKRNLRIIFAFSRGYIQQAFAYRWASFLWVINASVVSLVMMYIWMLVTPETELVVSYFVGMILMNRLTGSWSFGSISDGIINGTISGTIAKPFHYIIREIAHDIGNKANRMISLIPYVLILALVFSSQIQLPTLNNVLLSIPAILLGYTINLLFPSGLALLTIWIGDGDGVGRTYEIIENLAAGYLIPYFLMPELLRNVVAILPFRYIASFPVEILLNTLSTQELVRGYFTLFLWTCFSIGFFIWIDKKSIKNFVSHGG